MRELEQQRKAEVRALARLAGDELGGAVDGVGRVHRAISDRVFFFVGPLGRPVKTIHDVISEGVYTAVSAAAVEVGVFAEQTADLPAPAPPSRTVWGAGLIAAVQGLIGDTLEVERPLLAAPMSVRVDGAPVLPEDVATAFPNASGRIVVFLHGLVESEFAWQRKDRETYGERLERDLGATPVFVRYNSGLRIGENGRQLAELLEWLVAAWPVPVTEIAFVGHSMGGMVARCAGHVGGSWVRYVRHIVCLGSPHTGAPLEQLVHYASAALVWVPETSPFGRLLRRRSAGIRDLRKGTLFDDDDVPLLDGVAHWFVTATVTRNPRHPLGAVIGDGLVLVPSASGRSRSRRIGFEASNGMHLAGANHFTLLNHDAIYEQLRDWLRVPASDLGRTSM